MKLKTIVIDDEPLALGLLESYVKKTPFLDLTASFSSAIEAINSVELADADLLFLDIQMPTLTGLEFSTMVQPRTRIVFTTAFSQYALDGYKVNALDYLLKPIAYVDFLNAANKALAWFELYWKSQEESVHVEAAADDLCSADYIYVKSDYKLLRIELKEVLYVEGLKDYVQFFLEDCKEPVRSLMSMRDVEEKLPEKDFIRVHRSFIVRKDKIKVIDRSRIVFGNVYIPIGDAYKSQIQAYIQGF